jgi:hypothetical protein
MVENLQDYLCRYMQGQSDSLKGCLLAAYESREHYLSLLDESLGTPVQSDYIKMCEVLVGANLLREEIKITRDGRNRYKVFYLTEQGTQIAKKIREDGYSGSVPQNTPIDNL